MALREYKPGTAFPGVIGRTFDVSSPAWPQPLRAKEGAPNVLFIVLDDVGFAQIGCFGGPCETPNAGFEKNWIPSVPGKAWFAYFRLYAPTEAHFDRTWMLPDFESVKRGKE